MGVIHGETFMEKQTLNAFPAVLIACFLALTPLSAHAQLILYDAMFSQDNVLTGSVHLEFTDDGGSHELIALTCSHQHDLDRHRLHLGE